MNRWAQRLTLLLTLWVLPVSADQPLLGPASAATEGQRKAEPTRPNVLLICVDDLRPELGCYGVGYVQSPNIDRLAKRSTLFSRHFVQAPTCGASRFALLTGRYGGVGNGALFQRANAIRKGKSVPPSMPHWFRTHGYRTVSVGKVSHHPGGRGGPNWDDSQQPEMPNSWDRHLLPAGKWQHPRGWMHGLANGEIRVKPSEMDVYQAVEGDDLTYPDGPSIDEALNQMKLLAKDEKPFFLAVGVLRPHLPFGAPKKYLDLYKEVTLPPIPHPKKPTGKTTWHGSGEFFRYNHWGKNPNQDAEHAKEVRRHYAACVSYADAQVGKLLEALRENQVEENTVIVLWGDHGWHLGEHAIWGKHSLFEESLRSPLLIYAPSSGQARKTELVTETIDIFPTLCELSGLDRPQDCSGDSMATLVEKGDATSVGIPQFAISYKGGAQTIRSDRYRMIQHKSGHIELYDHQSAANETENIADAHPDVVKRLGDELKRRLK